MRVKKILKVKPSRSIAGNTANIIVLTALGAFMVIPMVFVISNAFKPLDELFVYPPRLFVRNPTFNNFTMLSAVFSETWVPFMRYVFNTFFITGMTTAGQVLIASMAGYVLEKKRFKGRGLLFNMVVMSLMFSGAVTAIPSYLIMSRIGWIDSYLSIIIPAAGSSLGVFLMKQFISNIENTIIEAARVDGAGEQQIFWKIVMPNVKPAWLTLIIFTVQNMWGTTGSAYLYSEELKTMPFALSQIVAGGIIRTGAGAAISLLMMLVPITVFLTTQKNIIQTMMSSGIKG